MSQKKQSFRPQLEALEQRSLMACNVFLDANGALNIIGDAANDQVTVYDSGHGAVLGIASGHGPFSFANVHSIIIDTGGGDDVVNYQFIDDIHDPMHKVEVNLRSGNDQFNCTFYDYWSGGYRDVTPGSLLLMKVVGEEGNDRMFFDAGGGVDMDHSTMKISFYGGLGDDILGMAYNGLNDHGGVSFFAYGNEGNDTIRMSMVADPASVSPAPGGFRGIIEGNDGDDDIYFHLSAPRAVSTVESSINGGRGRDRAYTNIDPTKIFEVENITLY